jgi:hypothetical protein
MAHDDRAAVAAYLNFLAASATPRCSGRGKRSTRCAEPHLLLTECGEGWAVYRCAACSGTVTTDGEEA